VTKPAEANVPPKTFRDCPNCPEMVVIPPGKFQMGAAPGENQRFQVPATEAGRDEPQHQVTFAKPFALAKFDITRAEFAAFANAANFRPRPGCLTFAGGSWTPQPQGSWQEPGFPQTDRDPAVCMNEIEINAYLGWLRRETGKDYRLPSEAEWEYAARGGTTTAYYWGDDVTQACAYENVGDETHREKYGGSAAIPCRDGFADTAPVGSLKPNPFGLYDMLGNVYVTVADCWNESYAGAPSDGSAWMTGDCARHVARKAGFGSAREWALRADNRLPEGSLAKRNRFGFRVALSLP
jgi:formylglycine-generating enzyme required for sulfatase activity